MRAWALGPTASFDGFFNLTNCFNVVGRCQLSFLACQDRSKLTIRGDATSANRTQVIKNSPKFWHAIESYDTRLGLSFKKQCFLPICCAPVHLDVEGGYELINDRRIVSRICISTQAFSFNEWSDFTLTGPYLSLKLTY